MVKLLTKAEYSQFVENNDGLLVVKFGAPWCQPCKLLSETIESLEPISGVTFAEVNVDDAEEELVSDFNIRNIPVLVFVKEGLNIERTVGLLTAESLLNKIEENKNK